jgi:adenylate kinase family enzyme
MSHAFIFIGRSGCGKGTQAELLMDSFTKTGALSGAPILYIETGDRFREFVKGESFSSTLAQKINADGRRQPDFLACAMWTEVLIAKLTGKEHVVLDGTPRSIIEAEVLTTALDFYGFEKRINYYSPCS